MNKVSYGDWIIDVNKEETKKYYQQFIVMDSDNQCYRNFQKYCDNMPNDEKQFFNSFGIDPKCCNIQTLGMCRDKTLPTAVSYIFFGDYIKKPQQISLTVEEFIENDFVDDRPDPRINIGIFQFDFQDPDSSFATHEDMPEGCICIKIWIQNLPWLLNEKCEHRAFEMPRWWEIIKKVKLDRRNKKIKQEDFNEQKNNFVKELTSLGIPFSAMSKKEVANYMREWVNSFAPKNADTKRLNEICFPTRKWNNYLWHIFSYEVLESENQENSSVCYDKIEKIECVVLANYHKFGFTIKDANALTSEILSRYSYSDIIVTAKDFSWTYAYTHESDCGPYFFDKNNPPQKTKDLTDDEKIDITAKQVLDKYRTAFEELAK